MINTSARPIIMQTLYLATFHGVSGRKPVASFLNRATALEFIKSENDAVQAEMLELEEFPLVDDYGFPFSPCEWPERCLHMVGEV
jgi:hypothetical protein